MSISSCLIIKNEEKNLEHCLKSISKFSDEIIIVDTGSTDKSKEIASKFTNKIFDFNWNDNFAEARNFGLSKATKEFIFSIDADEYVENPEEINLTISNKKTNTGGWLVNVISKAYDKNGNIEKMQTSLLRLFQNNPKIKFEGIIHEQVFESILSLGLKIENSNIVLQHTGYLLSSEDFIKKQKRNIELLKKALEREPQNYYLLTHLGKTYSALAKPNEAKEIFKEVIDNCSNDSIYKVDALNYYSVLLFEDKKYRDTIKYAQQSLQIIPKQANVYYIIGDAYLQLNELDQAYYSYNEALNYIDSEDIISNILGQYQIPKENIYYKIGFVLTEMKIYEDAIKNFENGLRINPTDFPCLLGIANTAYQMQNYDLGNRFLNEIEKLYPNNPYIEKLRKSIKQNNESQLSTNKNENIKQKLNQNQIGQSKKPFLSLSMIVKDEEKFIKGCLESVKDIADEIIIVDTGSKDKTMEIAHQYTNQIYQFKWSDDFAAARNEALRHCTGEWILYLDADERLAITDKAAFLNFLKYIPLEIGGINCLIESNHLNFDGATEVHRGGYPRLFRNLGYPNIYFRGRVHEQISPSILEQGKAFINSDIKIEHLGYNQNREVMESKIRRNYKLLLQHVKEEPTNGYAWYQLGQTLAQMKLVKEAEDAVRMAIQCGNLSKSVLASASSTLAQIMGNKKNFQEALYWAEESLKNAPDQVFAMNLKGYALLYLGRFDESLQAFQETLLRIKQKRGIPQSGFDVEIPEEIVIRGMQKAQTKDSNFN